MDSGLGNRDQAEAATYIHMVTSKISFVFHHTHTDLPMFQVRDETTLKKEFVELLHYISHLVALYATSAED